MKEDRKSFRVSNQDTLIYDIRFVKLCLSEMELRDSQLKVIFEMLKVLIDNMEEIVGYDFSHAEVLFNSSTDKYNKLVDDNFKSDYAK